MYVVMSEMNIGPTTSWQKYGRKTPMFSWEGQCVKARIVDVHDADSCRAVFPTADASYKQFIIRLDGIDGPEVTSHNPKETAAALRARNRLLSLLAPGVFDADEDYSKKDILRMLEDNVVLAYLALGKSDKYSRTLAQIFTEKDTDLQYSVNHTLLDEGMATEYHGKTKVPWVDWSARSPVG